MTRPTWTATNRRKFLKQVGSAAIASVSIGGRIGSAQPSSATLSESTGADLKGDATVLENTRPSSITGSRVIHINRRYLNIPIARKGDARLFQLIVNGAVRREFPLQLAEDFIDYWIFLDVSEFDGQTVTLSGPATETALSRMYQSDEIAGAATLYKERNRPQFHFTVRRGWNNDVNGPIFYKGQYHLFWQAFPFGVIPDNGFMYWGHAVGSDLIHWRELPPALRLDTLGSPWSGTAIVDHRNDGGWGKDALVLVFTAYDRISQKQVQCIAYSTDDGVTFTRFAGNPVVDSNRELGTTQTRDPKVFWYGPTRRWVMVLFEKDGMSFYNSTDLRSWTRKSHIQGFHECPDFFELPVDGDIGHKKWVLHGGSSSYLIGSFDGATFTPESSELRYAEGKNMHGEDVLYAAQSFAEMPNDRRVQMAWGRIAEEGMPFSQMLLFPTEFRLTTTKDGLRLLATPIKEIEELHLNRYVWSSLSAEDANQKLRQIAPGPLHVKAQVAIEKDTAVTIRYQGNSLATIQSGDFEGGRGSLEILIDACVAEIFVDGGKRYIIRETPLTARSQGLEFDLKRTGAIFNSLEVYEMRSMWSEK